MRQESGSQGRDRGQTGEGCPLQAAEGSGDGEGRFSRLLPGRSVRLEKSDSSWGRVVVVIKATLFQRGGSVTGGRKVVKSLQVGIHCRICRGYLFRLVVLKRRVPLYDGSELRFM